MGKAKASIGAGLGLGHAFLAFAPTHVCVISPERLGLCGAYNWLDGRAAYEINPTGGNQPVAKGAVKDAGVNHAPVKLVLDYDRGTGV